MLSIKTGCKSEIWIKSGFEIRNLVLIWIRNPKSGFEIRNPDLNQDFNQD
jgi:hypothetical protein